MESFGLALSTPKKSTMPNAPIIAKQNVPGGKEPSPEKKDVATTQTRSKSNLKEDSHSESLSQKSIVEGGEGSVGSEGSDKHSQDTSLCHSPGSGSQGADHASPVRDSMAVNSELSFIYNPTTPLKMKSLIDEKDRGDVKIMSDALNQMYFFMQDSQSKTDAFVRYSLEKFMRIDDSIASVANRVNRAEGVIAENENSIAFLAEDKVSKSEMGEIRGTFP